MLSRKKDLGEALVTGFGFLVLNNPASVQNIGRVRHILLATSPL